MQMRSTLIEMRLDASGSEEREYVCVRAYAERRTRLHGKTSPEKGGHAVSRTAWLKWN
jgi:hypothetical protein